MEEETNSEFKVFSLKSRVTHRNIKSEIQDSVFFNMAINWFKYSSPATFYFLAGKMIPRFAIAAVVLGVVGLYIGFFVAPTDLQQGEAYRIIFIHVPAAWLSMFLYLVMAVWSGIGLASIRGCRP